MVDYVELGYRIKRRRKALKMTQASVAEKINIGDKFLSHIENGKGKPSLDTIISICEVLDVSPDYLLRGLFVSKDGDPSEEMFLHYYHGIQKQGPAKVKLLLDIMKNFFNTEM